MLFFRLQVGQKFSKKWVNFQSKNSNGINYITSTKSCKVIDESQKYRFLNKIYKKIGINQVNLKKKCYV